MKTGGGINPSVKAVQGLAVAYMGQWVQEWRALHPGVPAASNFTTPDPNTLPQPPVFVPYNIPEGIINAPPPPVAANVLVESGQWHLGRRSLHQRGFRMHGRGLEITEGGIMYDVYRYK